jgi:hypothetical protein
MKTSPIYTRLGVLALLGAILPVASCGGGGGSDGAGSGTLSLQITDAAVDTAQHVYVQFSGLELHAADGQGTTLYYCQDPADATLTIVSADACTTPAAPKRFDLLALNSGNSDFLLEDFTLPAGHYNWIRLMVDTSGEDDTCIVVDIGGECHELTIPSNDQTGLKLNRGFSVPAGGSADFTIDFDLRKSVHLANNEYMLRPTLRLADNVMASAITGTVNDTLMTATCDPVNDHPAVYVFSGDGVTPDDVDGITPDPITSASVKLDSNDGKYKYYAAFLEAGDYTVAFTCDAADDDPAVDNTLNAPLVSFSGTTTVSVTAEMDTVHNF